MSRDLYAEVTDKIIEALDNGVIPWKRNWTGGGYPTNYVSKAPYRGINTFLLWAETAMKGYESKTWLTFNQARKAGGAIRKGEKGTVIVFWKLLETKELGENGKPKTIPMLRHFVVFNLEQCEGIEDKEPPAVIRDEAGTIAECEAILSQYSDGPSIKHEGVQPLYAPGADQVMMPVKERFHSDAAYYSVLFHELAHSTGHKTRLNRDLQGWSNKEKYAKEELIAEMASAFLCEQSGIAAPELLENTAAYIDGWRKAISEDKTLVIQAAAAGRDAAERISGGALAKAAKEAQEDSGAA